MERKNKRRSISMFLALAILVLFFGFAILSAALSQKPNYTLTNLSSKKSAQTYMEIADTTLSRMRGLMFREKIIPILFVFGSEGIYPIHSRFVKDEFDAIYISSDYEVMEIFRKVPPNTNLVTPTKKAVYLLELPVDITDKLKIAEGDRLSWKELETK